MAYSKTTWANSPATTSAISAANLNNMEDAIAVNDGITTIVKPTYASFTPKLWDGTNSPTYTYQEGYYYKVGSLIFVEIYLAISSKGSCSGSVLLGDLPFESSGISPRIMQGLNVIHATGITYPAGIVTLTLGGPRSVDYMNLYGNGSTTATINWTALAASTLIRISGVYRI